LDQAALARMAGVSINVPRRGADLHGRDPDA